MKKVFSFSLYGNDPIYTIGTLKNVKIIKKLFPGWFVYIYTNKKNDSLINELKSLGGIIKEENDEGWYNSTWRFKPISEEDVSVMVCRDSDSRINERDVIGINEWLDSDYNYHIIRDHPIGHRWRINAGMWGSKKTDYIKDIPKYIVEYKKNYTRSIGKTFDQEFLGDVIYPNIVNNSLIHDEYYNMERHSKKMDHDRKTNHFAFIGESIDENDVPRGDQRSPIKCLYK